VYEYFEKLESSVENFRVLSKSTFFIRKENVHRSNITLQTLIVKKKVL